MKIALHARQEKEYLDRADEIIFTYNDKDAIPNYIKQYKNKTIVLLCPSVEIDWDEIKKFKALANNNFLLGIDDIDLVSECHDNDIKFYFTYPITSYDELNVVLALGSYYVRLGAPLFFDMDTIHTYFPEAKIRIIPNKAYSDIYDRETGIYGTWIRPEDLDLYNEYATILEFEDADLSKERALFRIYIEEKAWPGEMEMIISDIGFTGMNPMIFSEVSEKRLNCRQVCQAYHNCKICKRAFLLADRDKVITYRDAVIPKYQAPKEEEVEE